MTTFGPTTLTYDFNGNMTSTTDSFGTATYVWDARNRLTSITAPGLAASFQYDAVGRRMTKTINSTATSFLYDGVNPVQELSGTTPTANLLTGLGIDEFFIRTDSLGTRAVLPNAVGSTIALADNTGTVQTSYTYDPFGNTTTGGTASTNSYQYTGRENDGTGLSYYRARYYNPRIQRFISEDPIEFSGGDADLYAYVRNSPVNFSDPSGLFAMQGPIPPGCEPPLDKQEKYFQKFMRELGCSLNFLPVVGGFRLFEDVLGFAKHGIDQVINRGVSPSGILDALREPLQIRPVVIDELGRPSQRIIGREAEVVINPETKNIVSVNPTSSEKVRRLTR